VCNYSHEGFEILGIKWLPSLSNNQAKELTPYEIGDKHWKASIHTLTSGKLSVCLPGIDDVRHSFVYMQHLVPLCAARRDQ
jgi:hypothetical protein